MILITGDIHGSHDIHKLSNKGNPDFKDIFTGKDGMFLNFHNAGGMDLWGVFFFFIASPYTLFSTA